MRLWWVATFPLKTLLSEKSISSTTQWNSFSQLSQGIFVWSIQIASANKTLYNLCGFHWSLKIDKFFFQFWVILLNCQKTFEPKLLGFSLKFSCRVTTSNCMEGKQCFWCIIAKNRMQKLDVNPAFDKTDEKAAAVQLIWMRRKQKVSQCLRCLSVCRVNIHNIGMHCVTTKLESRGGIECFLREIRVLSFNDGSAL